MIDLIANPLRNSLLLGAFLLLVVVLGVRNRPRWRSLATLAVLVALTVVSLAIADGVIDGWISRRQRGAEFDESHWLLAGPWGSLATVLGLAAFVGVVGLAWIGSARVKSPFARATLVGLRSGAAVAALCLFFQPAIELRQVTREPNRVAVLIDDSQSMTLTDKPDSVSRIERARTIMENSRSSFDAWKDRHRVDVYRFAKDLNQMDSQLSALSGKGESTLIRRALEQVRSRYRGRDLAGIVVISDGIATGELGTGDSGETEAFLRALDVPVHTILAAQPGLVDIAVAEVFADEFAFVRTVFTIDALIRSSGIGTKRIKVTLSGNGKPMRSKWVDLPAAGGDLKVSFELTPSKLGRYVYTISVPIVDGEVVTTNNQRAFVVRVIRDKVRVLQVAGSPSWDVRALRGLLKSNPNVDLISFFILRNNDDVSPVSNSELSLIRFPTRELFVEELPSFDLVILQNFNLGPYGIAPYLENIRTYVEKGGALAILGGALAFSSGDYAGTPLEPALPIALINPQSSNSLIDTKTFRARLTKSGRSHPVTAMRHRPTDNTKVWNSLAKLDGINRVAGLRRGAVALAVHPTEKMNNGKPAPVIVSGQYGAGRTLAILTDSLWKWGFVAAQSGSGEPRAYLKFWENATRWLLDDPDYRYLRVESDKVAYQPLDKPRLNVHLLGRDYQPAEGSVHLTISRGVDSAASTPIRDLKISTDLNGRAIYSLAEALLAQSEKPLGEKPLGEKPLGEKPLGEKPLGEKPLGEKPLGEKPLGENNVQLTPGVYRIHATTDVDGYRAESSDVFIVRETSSELDQPSPSSTVLERVASQTGGSFLAAALTIPEDLKLAEPRIVRVDSRSEVELWSRPWLLFLALVLLGIEWALRQKWGYR